MVFTTCLSICNTIINYNIMRKATILLMAAMLTIVFRVQAAVTVPDDATVEEQVPRAPVGARVDLHHVGEFHLRPQRRATVQLEGAAVGHHQRRRHAVRALWYVERPLGKCIDGPLDAGGIALARQGRKVVQRHVAEVSPVGGACGDQRCAEEE